MRNILYTFAIERDLAKNGGKEESKNCATNRNAKSHSNNKICWREKSRREGYLAIVENQQDAGILSTQKNGHKTGKERYLPAYQEKKDIADCYQ